MIFHRAKYLLVIFAICLVDCIKSLSQNYNNQLKPIYNQNKNQREYLPSQRVPLHVDNYVAPQTVTLEDGVYLVYELHISNFYYETIKLDGIEVLSDTISKKVLFDCVKDCFQSKFKNIATSNDSLKMNLLPGQRGILFMWVKLHDKIIPSELYHNILVEIGTRKSALPLPPIVVATQLKPYKLISPPLKGLWLVGQGADPEVESVDGHNRLLYPYAGKLRIPQRYATDWVKLNDSGKAFEGDLTINENYYGFGDNVYAVADGIILQTQNDVPENIPPNMTVPRTAKNITGNFVILKLENNKSAYYGHLKTGSVIVKPGDKVKAGQVIAKVGNTGNSTAAHLHFQIQSGDLFMDEGYPYEFLSVKKFGQMTKSAVNDVADKGASFKLSSSPTRLKNVHPSYGSVLFLE